MTETAGNQPLVGAVVTVNGQAVAVTDTQGAFEVPTTPIRWGPNELVIRHSAFVETIESDEFWITNPNETLEFAAELNIAPILLPGLDVETQAMPEIPERLRGFYERRDRGGGTFWTTEEVVRRDAPNMVQLFRGVRFREAALSGGSCRPVVLINGTLGDLLDLIPEHVAAVEIYRSIAFIPIQFSHLAERCGMIVLWTH